MIEIILTGAAGRMGKTLVRLIAQDPELKLAGAIDAIDIPPMGKDAGEIAGIDKIGVNISNDLNDIISKGDVVIDFSSAGATLDLLEIACGAKKAMVIGTTGHGPGQIVRLKEASEDIPLLVSPNMSVGVNLLWKLTDLAAKTLGRDYSTNIMETHHVHKKDAPSGTAKRLLEIVTQATGQGIDKISVKSTREGEVVGNHAISFTGAGEKIELSHQALTREIFAHGAIRAAKWIVDKPAGLYDMWDVLFGA